MSAINAIDEVKAQLSAGGGIAQTVENFKVRDEQLAMAEAVAQTALDLGTAVIEAGTGTGKTFAYLVPALLLGEKVIISTGTRNLQNQLFHKDLPIVRESLQKPVVTALLKGRSNYLCRYRLEQYRFVKHMFSRHQARQLAKIEAWAQSTREGDISELADLPESDSVWAFATSSADNCLGQDCPHFDDCHLNKARKAALDADVVVINHHLFFADALMREEGFGELLPEADLIILDEAHQLADVVSHFFGMTLSSRKVKRLCSDIDAEVRESANDMGDLLSTAEALPPIVDRLQHALENSEIPQKGAWLEIADHASIVGHVDDLGAGLKALAINMKEAGVRSRGLQSCERRLNELLALYRVITEDRVAPVVASNSEAVNEMSNYVQWFERYKSSLRYIRHRSRWLRRFPLSTTVSSGLGIYFGHLIGEQSFR